MKLIQFLFTGLLLSGFSGLAQNVASTVNLTSGGLNAGTSGSENTFYGYQAGMLTTNNSGIKNTYIGHQTGAHNKGNRNVFLGNQAGQGDSYGSDNLFIGNSSGENNGGSGNVYIGNHTGQENDGSYNTYIGHRAGLDASGSHNVLIGNDVGYSLMESNKLLVDNSDNSAPLIWGDFALDQLKLNGKVGIGNGFANFPTTAGSVNVANYNLFVKGGILTEEVRVNLQSNWADYVFATDYKLKPLEEVENYIQENGHLENVPSAKKVKEEGIELGEMIKIQQEKIEELTLYLIQQNKEIKELKENLKSLKN